MNALKNWTLEEINEMVRERDPNQTLREAGVSRKIARDICVMTLVAAMARPEEEVAVAMVNALAAMLALGLEIQRHNQEVSMTERIEI